MDAISETPAGFDQAAPRGASAVAIGVLGPALRSLMTLTLVCGCVFPMAVFVLGRALFAAEAAGSLISRNGVVVGSSLIGQRFDAPEYFQARPSAAGAGYDASQSGGSNLSPANPALVAAVGASAADYRRRNGLPPQAPVPIDAVTRSGSGLDPDVSPENAALQVRRVAHVRGLSEAYVAELVAQHTRGRDLSFMGAPRVSVLALNLALDRSGAEPGRGR